VVAARVLDVAAFTRRKEPARAEEVAA
jgi:hypothetical protein